MLCVEGGLEGLGWCSSGFLAGDRDGSTFGFLTGGESTGEREGGEEGGREGVCDRVIQLQKQHIRLQVLIHVHTVHTTIISSMKSLFDMRIVIRTIFMFDI